LGIITTVVVIEINIMEIAMQDEIIFDEGETTIDMVTIILTDAEITLARKTAIVVPPMNNHKLPLTHRISM